MNKKIYGKDKNQEKEVPEDFLNFEDEDLGKTEEEQTKETPIKTVETPVKEEEEKKDSEGIKH